MQKQQDMGNAHWLSKPTLAGGVVTLHSRHYRTPNYGFTCHAKGCAARKFLTSYLGFCQVGRYSYRSDQPQHLFLFRRIELNSVECPPLVKLLFGYPDHNFSNDLQVTSAPRGFPATWEPQTLFVVHQCTKPCSLALKSSLPSGCSPLQVQFWTCWV